MERDGRGVASATATSVRKKRASARWRETKGGVVYKDLQFRGLSKAGTVMLLSAKMSKWHNWCAAWSYRVLAKAMLRSVPRAWYKVLASSRDLQHFGVAYV